jgi:hypothetical protein
MSITEKRTYGSIDEFLNARYQTNAYSARSQTRKKIEYAKTSGNNRFVISLGGARLRNGYHVLWNLYGTIFADGHIETVKVGV